MKRWKWDIPNTRTYFISLYDDITSYHVSGRLRSRNCDDGCCWISLVLFFLLFLLTFSSFDVYTLEFPLMSVMICELVRLKWCVTHSSIQTDMMKHRNNMIRMLTRHIIECIYIDKMLRAKHISWKYAMKSRCTKFNSHNATSVRVCNVYFVGVLDEFRLECRS